MEGSSNVDDRFQFVACNSLDIESGEEAVGIRSGAKWTPTPDDGTQYEAADPEGDVIEFRIVPDDGWVVGPGETIVFAAWLWDAGKGRYVDVTGDTHCKFDMSHFGKCVNGDDPSLANGQQITISAIYNGVKYASSTGTFVCGD